MKYVLMGSIIIFLMTGVSYAALCELPAFLKIGKDYTIMPSGVGEKPLEIQLLEIDKQACWIKIKLKNTEKSIWINMIHIQAIAE